MVIFCIIDVFFKLYCILFGFILLYVFDFILCTVYDYFLFHCFSLYYDTSCLLYQHPCYCSAYQNNDINDFERILKQDHKNIMHDPFIREHIEGASSAIHSDVFPSKAVVLKLFRLNTADNIRICIASSCVACLFKTAVEIVS